MTGAEVLVIVQTDRERKICASDLLKNQYESGKLAPTGTKEFANVTKTIKPEDGESLGVAPLEDTPKKLPLDENMSELFGLNIHGRAANQNVNCQAEYTRGSFQEAITKSDRTRKSPLHTTTITSGNELHFR